MGGGERRPHSPPGTPQPCCRRGGVRGDFFPLSQLPEESHSGKLGSPPGTAWGAQGGFAVGSTGKGSPGGLGTAGCARPARCVSGSQGCGWDAAVPPAHAALPGLASPREEGAKLPETTSRHSSQRHPGGISRGAWAGLESKASLPSPAGRAARPRSAPRHATRAEPSQAVLSRATAALVHRDMGRGATR